jgi:ribosomal protein S6--L-glutamate ligase
MKTLFLVEDENNETASNLITAFKRNKNIDSVDIISYFSNNKNQCATINIKGTPALLYKNKTYSPLDYDAALLWSWGTADLGRAYLRIFEDSGVPVLNSSYTTEVTDSKICFTKKLQKNNIKTPNTMYFETALSTHNISTIKENLGIPPYVFKSDYGTQGSGIRFAHSEADIAMFAKELQVNKSDHQAFLVQQFIGNCQKPIFHYRVFVIGDEVLPKAIKITAQTPLAPSNIARGGDVAFVNINPYLKTLALNAAITADLTVAGVDIMVDQNSDIKDAVVIEVNDGPGTKTFDRYGLKASDSVVAFFVNDIEAKYRIANQQIIGL